MHILSKIEKKDYKIMEHVGVDESDHTNHGYRW